jgi:nitrous oxidase accessory protein
VGEAGGRERGGAVAGDLGKPGAGGTWAAAALVALLVTAGAWRGAEAASSRDGAGRGAIAPGGIEGRPPAAETSPLQARVDAAAAGATVEVEAGEYVGDLIVDKPLRLVGHGRPLLVGSASGSVVRVRAPDVTVEGFDIDGRRGGNLGRDTAGIHTAAPRTTIRDCRIREALFGIYLREAPGAVVEGCRIRGIPDRDPGDKGSGIHVWNTEGFRLVGNEIVDVRDGFYIQSSYHGLVRGNTARDLRYGLHYMFSDDNVFEENTFANGDAGTAIMYSNRLTFRRNRFLRNRGFASVGLLFKTCEDVLAEDNLIADNARGIFMDDVYRGVFRRNVIAGSDAAVVLYQGAADNRFEDNAFVGNLTPLQLEGRHTDTVFLGNYFSGNEEPDLDGDGRSDRPYRLSSVFDHLRGNLTAADLLSDSFAAAALGAAERAFPVLRPVSVEDPQPRARPPDLPDVPRPARAARGVDLGGLLAALALFGLGAGVMARGRRPRRTAPPPSPNRGHESGGPG